MLAQKAVKLSNTNAAFTENYGKINILWFVHKISIHNTSIDIFIAQNTKDPVLSIMVATMYMQIWTKLKSNLSDSTNN